MPLRITISVILLLGVLLVTGAENMDFLSPKEVKDHCHYLDTCSDNSSYNYCEIKCANNGYNSAGASCVRRETNRTCCCLDDKTGLNSDSCHYVGECDHNDECMTICGENGYKSSSVCVQLVTYNCCCLVD